MSVLQILLIYDIMDYFDSLQCLLYTFHPDGEVMDPWYANLMFPLLSKYVVSYTLVCVNNELLGYKCGITQITETFIWVSKCNPNNRAANQWSKLQCVCDGKPN